MATISSYDMPVWKNALTVKMLRKSPGISVPMAPKIQMPKTKTAKMIWKMRRARNLLGIAIM